jgi:hypothetical protein
MTQRVVKTCTAESMRTDSQCLNEPRDGACASCIELVCGIGVLRQIKLGARVGASLLTQMHRSRASALRLDRDTLDDIIYLVS